MRLPLLALALLALADGATAEPRALKLATYAYPRYDRAAALRPMAEHLAKTLGRPVTTTVLASPDALSAALRAGEVDIAVTNLAAYRAAAATPTVRASAMFEVPPATLDAYRGVLLARAGIDPSASGLRYIRVIPGSTSGALVQDAWLGERVKALSDAGFAGTHDAAMGKLLDGSADLAALAEDPWRKLKADKPTEAARLVEIWRSAPIPPGPIVCVQAADNPCDAVAKALTAPEASSAAQALSAAWSETAGATRLVPADPKTYAPFLR